MENYESFFSLTPVELLNKLTKRFDYKIPEKITTKEDMENAQALMLRLTGDISYLFALQSYAKIETSRIKRLGLKEDSQDAIDKKEVIANFLDALKQQYNGVSRAVTIVLASNEEAKYNGRGSVA